MNLLNTAKFVRRNRQSNWYGEPYSPAPESHAQILAPKWLPSKNNDWPKIGQLKSTESLSTGPVPYLGNQHISAIHQAPHCLLHQQIQDVHFCALRARRGTTTWMKMKGHTLNRSLTAVILPNNGNQMLCMCCKHTNQASSVRKGWLS